MLQQMINFLVSWFSNPSGSLTLLLISIGLAIAFGAIWLAGYLPPLFKNPWLLVVMVSSALLTLLAIAFIQIPLQWWTGQALTHFWSQQVLMKWILLVGIPQILLSGLVQEGSKLVPVVIYWWRSGKSLDPKLGLIVGAVAGAGFGIYEAEWAHNIIFASGWSWSLVQTQGLLALAGFWERSFTVAFHTGVSALAGYGFARGWKWQAYLVAAFLHGLTNYGIVLFQAGILTIASIELYVAVIAVIVTAAALWLRWREVNSVVPEASPQDTKT